MKTSVKLLAAALMLSTTALAPLAASAATAGELDSNAKISFEAGTDPEVPVDPTDPTDPIDPTDPDNPGPGTGGPLSIDYASHFYFGKQKITSKDMSYYADAEEYKDSDGNLKEGPTFVQVSDNRGTLAGWNLTVVQNGQFKSPEGEELDGAALILNKGHVVTTSSATNTATGSATTTLDPKGTVLDVMDAEVGKGAGTFQLAWGTDATDAAKSVELQVPGDAIKLAKEYKTTLTWTLNDVPKGTTTPTPPAP